MKMFPESTINAASTIGKCFGGARILSLSLAALAAVVATSVLAVAAFDAPPGGDGGGDDGSDPTVGTLPMIGDTEDDFFDQTLTLRGRTADVAAAVGDASGNGAAEIIDLGNGEVWVRYFGDVTLELDLSQLAGVQVGIFTGFEGNGMSYSVGQATGFGDVRRLPSGSDIKLDPIRLVNSGVLGQTLMLGGLHQDGTRTMTTIDYVTVDGMIVLRQDV